jgi:predicted nucleic acid-binding protein
MAAEPTFVDTNVIVHSNRGKSPFFARAGDILRREREAGTPLWLSRQIIREYLAVVTRAQATEPALPFATASANVAGFLANLNVAEDGPRVTDKLLELLDRHPSGGRQIHDANIVATMLTHGIFRLLTFNEADFRRFGGVIRIVVP